MLALRIQYIAHSDSKQGLGKTQITISITLIQEGSGSKQCGSADLKVRGTEKLLKKCFHHLTFHQ